MLKMAESGFNMKVVRECFKYENKLCHGTIKQ